MLTLGKSETIFWCFSCKIWLLNDSSINHVITTFPKAINSAVWLEFPVGSEFRFSHFKDKLLKFEEIEHVIITFILKCTANHLTGFYMRATLALNGLNQDMTFQSLSLSDLSRRMMITRTSLVLGHTLCSGFMVD